MPDTVTLQVPEPAHAPDHPSNTVPEAGFAANATETPLGNVPEHAFLLHRMPSGTLVTVPPPAPERDIRTGYSEGGGIEFSPPGVPPASALVCHPTPSASRSMVSLDAFSPAGQPDNDPFTESEAPQEGSTTARSSPALLNPPEYGICIACAYGNVVLPRTRRSNPPAAIRSRASNRTEILPDAFTTSHPASGTSSEESFLSSIHSAFAPCVPASEDDGDPIHAISLNFIFPETDEEAEKFSGNGQEIFSGEIFFSEEEDEETF